MSEITESIFSESMGIPRAVLRKLRKELTRGEHWEHRAEGITLTEAGQNAIREKLAREDPPAPGAPNTPTPERNGAPRLVWATITRFFAGNPKYMKGVTDEGVEVAIRTQDTRIFVRDMRLPCLTTRKRNILVYQGPKPRAKGRLHQKRLAQYISRLKG